ncbi:MULTISPECIES: hypothetical protein [Acidobacteriaceae]|uniref:hypothetical protein n=1 Tax=Acidobacteriaceae TaxID=204434 RepID=UPI00131DB531|nr:MULTISPECIES: hypothetical protein [Acidobacteriaceae]MDW5267061.1 hypothetical protein [Edaphobacter sp.]
MKDQWGFDGLVLTDYNALAQRRKQRLLDEVTVRASEVVWEDFWNTGAATFSRQI